MHRISLSDDQGLCRGLPLLGNNHRMLPFLSKFDERGVGDYVPYNPQSVLVDDVDIFYR